MNPSPLASFARAVRKAQENVSHLNNDLCTLEKLLTIRRNLCHELSIIPWQQKYRLYSIAQRIARIDDQINELGGEA